MIQDKSSTATYPIPQTSAEFKAFKAAAELRQRVQGWQSLINKIGRRYESCRLTNFEVDTPPKRAALDAVRSFADGIVDSTDDGQNLILFGPVGTGKDHLLTAVLREACKVGLKVDWRDGQVLFGELRDVITNSYLEADTLRALTSPQILAISDPLPAQGELTDYQSSWLFRVIDRRYREMKPTFVTINVADRKGLIARLGAPLADRLLDGAVAVQCKWTSYRKPVIAKSLTSDTDRKD